MTMAGRLWRLGVAVFLGFAFEAGPVEARQATGKDPASGWVRGDVQAKVNEIFEAWFDREAVSLGLDEPVILGSPSKVRMWLRGTSPTCAAAEGAGRTTAIRNDGSLLHVCARATATGQVVLGARAPSGAWRISEPIAIEPPYTRDPAVVSAITTAVSFLVGLLTAFVTQVIQDKRSSRREAEKIANAAKEALAGQVAAEILKNSKAIDDFLLAPQTPPDLAVKDFNSVFAAQKAAFDAIDSVHFARYRKRLEALYKTTMTRYEDSVTAWAAAAAADKPKALQNVVLAATEVRNQIHQF